MPACTVAESGFSVAGLVGMRLPSVMLPSTLGGSVNLAGLPPRCVLILHTAALARHQVPPPAWMKIPGAAGCTAQLLGFKAQHRAFQARRTALFGISTQSPIVQQAVAEDLALPFPLLSDADRALAAALPLPLLHAGRVPRLARLLLVVRHGCIAQVFDPIASPAHAAAEMLSWLSLQML